MKLEQTPTIRTAVSLAENRLRDGDRDARLEAEILLAHALDKPRIHLHTWPEHRLSISQYQQFDATVHARLEGSPIAHLTGTREFWSLDLKVSKDTLIPRPETELLVEIALELIPENEQWCIADLGTGCGSIALALAVERPRSAIMATDISTAALGIARENADAHGLQNISFLSGNWSEPLEENKFDLIASNPPYIAASDIHLTRGDLCFEPQGALVSGVDGLDDIRIIAPGCYVALKSGGTLILEHGFEQGSAVREILDQSGYLNVKTCKDLAGRDRITKGETT